MSDVVLNRVGSEIGIRIDPAICSERILDRKSTAKLNNDYKILHHKLL